MKVLSNKALEFSNREEVVNVNQGFNTIPDWVADTNYFKAAVADGSIKAFDTPTFSEAEKVLAAEEKAALEAKIAELEAELAKSKVVDAVVAPIVAPVVDAPAVEVPVEVVADTTATKAKK